MAKQNFDLENFVKEFSSLTIKQGYVKTGIIPFDIFISGMNDYVEGEVGFLRGKFYSFAGNTGVGKSTLMLDISRRFCKAGLKVIYFDFENGFNLNSLESFGLKDYIATSIEDFEKDKNMLLMNTKTFTNTSVFLYNLIEKNNVKVDCIIIDSLKAIQTKYAEENISDIENLPIGLNARSQENFIPFLKNLCEKNNIIGLFVNQMRIKFGGYTAFLDEPSNNAFRFGMDVRIVMKEDNKIVYNTINMNKEQVEKKIGAWVTFEVKKGRLGNSFATIKLPIIYGKGISLIYFYKDLLIKEGIITEPQRINSVINLKQLNEILIRYDEKNLSDTVSGVKELHNYILAHFDSIEKYCIENGLLKVDKSS